MKTLLLLRHAKSSWKEPDMRDFDRPLNERGRKAAPLIGAYLREQKLTPDLVLSSPAERARQTAALVIESAELNAELRYDERIYEASVEQLLEVVAQTGDGAGTLLLVGHNPGMEELIQRLTGASERMRTATLARIDLDTDAWSKVRAAEGAGRLKFAISPKDLAED
ncbi:MAG: SixA phosphatase family protein [Pyrinomonadaceae bacterium]